MTLSVQQTQRIELLGSVLEGEIIIAIINQEQLDAARSGSLRVKGNSFDSKPSLKGCIDRIFPSTSLCGNSSFPPHSSSLQHATSPPALTLNILLTAVTQERKSPRSIREGTHSPSIRLQRSACEMHSPPSLPPLFPLITRCHGKLKADIQRERLTVKILR